MTDTPERKESVFKGLMSILKSEDPMASMTQGFDRMLDLVVELVRDGGRKVFDDPDDAGYRERMERKDRQVNALERQLRKQVIAHLTLSSNKGDVPYGLLIMSLTRDVERVGDYAKHLAEIYDRGCGRLPEPGDANADELRALRSAVEAFAGRVGPAFKGDDTEAARALIDEGVRLGNRAEAVVPAVAAGGYDGPSAMGLTLVARYYKRIAAHLTAVVSGVVLPLHELHYHDEQSLTG